jgi:hypothetical protein
MDSTNWIMKIGVVGKLGSEVEIADLSINLLTWNWSNKFRIQVASSAMK